MEPGKDPNEGLDRLLKILCALLLVILVVFYATITYDLVTAPFRGVGIWSLIKELNDDAGDVLTAAVGFFALIVAFFALESSRLDHFVNDVESNSNRKRIYEAFCALTSSGADRRVEFAELLYDSQPTTNCCGSSTLIDVCDENVRLFARVGARLPWAPPFRTRALEWHVVVLLWWILGPYVIKRRRLAGPAFARTFVRYALASAKLMIEQERDHWTIVDPKRKSDVTLTRDDVLLMINELKAEKYRNY